MMYNIHHKALMLQSKPDMHGQGPRTQYGTWYGVDKQYWYENGPWRIIWASLLLCPDHCPTTNLDMWCLTTSKGFRESQIVTFSSWVGALLLSLHLRQWQWQWQPCQQQSLLQETVMNFGPFWPILGWGTIIYRCGVWTSKFESNGARSLAGLGDDSNSDPTWTRVLEC